MSFEAGCAAPKIRWTWRNEGPVFVARVDKRGDMAKCVRCAVVAQGPELMGAVRCDRRGNRRGNRARSPSKKEEGIPSRLGARLKLRRDGKCELRSCRSSGCQLSLNQATGKGRCGGR